MADEELLQEEVEATESEAPELEQAWEQHEAEVVTQPVEQESVGAKTDDNPETEKPETVTEVGETGDTAPQAAEAETEQQAAPEDPESLDSPPSSLPADARAVWDEIPDVMKAAIATRERQAYEGVKAATAKAKQFEEQALVAQDMSATIAPFQSVMAPMGGPKKAITSVLETLTLFQNGTKQQKAAAAAQLIQGYDVDIDTLAETLQNGVSAQTQQPQQGMTQQQIDQMIERRIAERERQQMGAHAVTEIQQFASNPEHKYYNDVSDMMANLLDVSAAQGGGMTIKDAYEQACWAHPQVRNAMMIEREREQLSTGNQQVAHRRAAASSISGSPAGNGTAAPLDMEGTLEHAWDSVGRL